MSPIDRACLLRQRWRYTQNHRTDIYRELLSEIGRHLGLVNNLPREARLDYASVALSYRVTVDVHSTVDGWLPMFFEPVPWELQKILGVYRIRQRGRARPRRVERKAEAVSNAPRPLS